MDKMRRAILVPVLAIGLLLPACGGGIRTTKFTNPRFDFGYLERVAVLPMENLSDDNQAGERVTRMIITELLASGSVDVVEPGEVRSAMASLRTSLTSPDTDGVIAAGKALGVQAVIVGSVTQSELMRSGTVSVPTVTLDLHMLETETGAPVWAATHTEKSSGIGARLLGTGSEPIAETTRRCVRRVLKSLLR